MYKVIQLISNFLYNENMPPSMKIYVHWMNLMKNQIIQQCQILKFWKKGLQGKGFFFLTIWQKNMWNGFKMSSFRCKSHVQEIILPKNMFSCPFKLILGFFVFLAINQNICTQLCMNMKTHHYHMSYLKLD
jgi:hypothetical protein